MRKILVLIGLLTFFLSACGGPLEVEVTFETNGGSTITSMTFNEETTFTLPNDPTKDGFTFDGWYLEETLETPFSIEGVLALEPVDTLTLYAKWTINVYTITFDSNGGSIVSAITQDYDTEVTTPSNPTKEGYTFDGWSEDIPEVMPAENLTFTATWTINQYAISYKTNEVTLFISLGNNHTASLTSLGRVFTWGNNTQGQLGDDTTTNRTTPTDITSQFLLTEGETIISLSFGGSHSSALTSTGRVFTWGHNSEGELGDGTITNRSTPIDITRRFPLTEGEIIMSLSLGYYYSSALTSTGRVFTWGFNDYGQLGDGSTSNRTTPTDITSQFLLSEGEIIMSLSFGGSNSSVLTSTGRVFTFGRNSEGELGDDTTTERTTPTDITYTIEILNLIFSFNYEEDITSYYIPVLEGYTFEGWYTDFTLTTKYVLNTMPAEDVVLYAKWI